MSVATPARSAAQPRVSRASLADSWFVLAVTIGLSSVYLATTLDQRWFPWDEGSLGEMAQRTLAGQLPHRDFADIYTGGLSFFDAGVFWVFGTDLLWLRVAMFPFFVLFVAAMYFVTVRLVRPWLAGLITFTVVVWTVPNYAAAMPSWYNLFFAVAGIASLVSWLETRSTRRLVLAGVFGGLSVDVKIVGLYYVAGVVFFLCWRAALHRGGGVEPASDRWASVRQIGMYGLAAAGLAATLWTLAPLFNLPMFVAFVPAVGAASVALAAAVRLCARSEEPIVRPVLLFLAGVAVPVAVFLIPYVVTGSVWSVFSDVFGSSQARLKYAAFEPPSASALKSVLPFVVLPFAGWLGHRGRLVAAVLFIVSYVLVLPSHDVTTYFVQPLREVMPVLAPAAAGAMILALRGRFSDMGTVEFLGLFLFVMSFMSLVQFPFAAPIYFQYVLPLVALTAVAFIRLVSPRAAAAAVVVVVAYLAAGLVHLQPGIQGAWARLGGTTGRAILDPQDGRIYIPAAEATKYRTVADLLRAHAFPGTATIAGPDTPEFYFLSGLKNLTPMIFDFLTPDSVRTKTVIAAAKSRDVQVIVINGEPEFSPQYDPAVLNLLYGLFPRHELIDEFDVRWR